MDAGDDDNTEGPSKEENIREFQSPPIPIFSSSNFQPIRGERETGRERDENVLRVDC